VHAALAGTRVLTGVMETEDTLGALLSCGPAAVTLNVTVASSVDWRTRIELVGSLGSVVFDLDHPGTLHHCSGPAELLRRGEAERARSLAEEPPGIAYYGVSHRRQIADFCRSVTDGTPMLASAQDAVGTLRTITDLYDKAGAR
jgi:predicted dehydrogenase